MARLVATCIAYRLTELEEKRAVARPTRTADAVLQVCNTKLSSHLNSVYLSAQVWFMYL